eukprot:9554309-Heterocapsa_arctica.AAC.1
MEKGFLLNHYNELMLEWLNMVRGLVDFENLVFNISREFLQQNKIKKNLVIGCLEMFTDIVKKKNGHNKLYE